MGERPDPDPDPADAATADAEAVNAVDGLVDALRGINRQNDERRLIFAKGENYRHIRHEQVLARWPVIPESWARRIERTRIDSVDRTPGPATFGR